MQNIDNCKKRSLLCSKKDLFERETFEYYVNNLNNFPNWFIDFKKSAWDKLSKVNYNCPKESVWSDDKFCCLEIPDLSFGVKINSILEDNKDILQNSGIKLKPLNESLDLEEVRIAFEKLLEKATHKLAILPLCYTSGGYFISIPKDTKFDKQIVIPCENHDTIFYTYIILASENSSSKISYFFGLSNSDETISRTSKNLCKNKIDLNKNEKILESCNFMGTSFYISLKSRSSLNFSFAQHLDNNTNMFSSVQSFLDERSYLSQTNILLSGNICKCENNTYLEESFAKADLNSLVVTDNSQNLYWQSNQELSSNNCESFCKHSVLATDESNSAFIGNIKISENANSCSANQQNPNLLLSKNAKTTSMPNIHIHNQESTCNHGSTIGYLNEEDMFYIRSRGIQNAEKFLACGFAKNALIEIPDIDLKTKCSDLISEMLAY